ncbi:hypothetical protein [Paenibacillus sp. FSL K6-2859]|uniref:hypothetical protein n=1 Tax=Paenibacillus sp. FSL K6-2859 TaxID=2921482 RepID=UPI0030FCE689
MNRIAIITESTARPEEPMQAFQFFQGKQSRWVNTVIQYMFERSFPRENIFFVSFYGQRIIGFEEIVDPYPLQRYHARKSEAECLARKVLDLVLSMSDLPLVEIHTGRTLADPLKKLFEENGISYRIYADGVPLGSKPNAYLDLIEQERRMQKQKDIQRDKRNLISCIDYLNPQEASFLVSAYGKQAQQLGIESNIEELKLLLSAYRQKQKDEKKAEMDFESTLQQEDLEGTLRAFLQSKQSLADLYRDEKLEHFKNAFGRTIAKFTVFLLKKSYVMTAESKISASMLRTQIALLK